MDLIRWLSAVLGLFSDTFDAVFAVPVFRLFLVFLLFMAVLRFLAGIANNAKHF